MRLSLVFFLLLAGCQTAQQKSQSLVTKRVGQLKHLSSWKPQWCQVDTELTEPVRARYGEMFPGEIVSNRSYVWRAREGSCEITPVNSSPLAKGHQAFLESALCLLMQVHYVNSPFDELEASAVEPLAELTHIKTGPNPDLGLFLNSDLFKIETRTKSRGILRATYADAHGVMLPSQLEQVRNGSVLVVDEIEYDSSTAGQRPQLRSFWISVGTDAPVRHSKAIIRDCRAL